jgi:hypothetical protein
MDRLIEEIRAALHANMFTLALQGSLTLIDICGALDSETGWAKPDKFKAWYTQHLSAGFEYLSADAAYELRCGIIHQGRSRSKDETTVVFFTLPNPVITINQGWHDGALSFDLVHFCETILGSVEAWWQSNQDVEPVKSNADGVVRIRPEGLPPKYIGLPVLA